MITAPFLRLELWSTARLESGVRLATWELGQIVAANVSYSVDGVESLVFSVPVDVPATALVDPTARQVVRVCSTDPTELEEWRVAETELNGFDSVLTIRCDSLLIDLARVVYITASGSGQPTAEFSAFGIDADGIWDGPITDALTDAGITWFAKGVVVPTATFDLDLAWATPLEFLQAVKTRVNAEIRLRNDLTASVYYVDILDAGGVGATAPVVYARTTRNLIGTERRIDFGSGGTRVIPRAKDDGTSQTIGYAYWQVTDVPDATHVVIQDPRGSGFPAPLANGAGTGWYVAPLALTYVSEEVLDTAIVAPGETSLEVADSSGFTVGDLVDFRLVDAADGLRPYYLTDSAAPPVFDVVLDRPALSGVVNYAPNPFVREYTGTAIVPTINNWLMSPDTTTDIIVGNIPVATGFGWGNQLQPGDVLYRASDDALIGTVTAITGSTPGAPELQLTANALITDTDITYYAIRAIPTGASVTDLATPSTVRTFLCRQVASIVPGITANAWEISFPLGSVQLQYNTPVFDRSLIDPDTQYTFWCWLTGGVPAGVIVDAHLRDASDNSIIGSVIQQSNIGPPFAPQPSLVRIAFTPGDISTRTQGVFISFRITAADLVGQPITIGPWGVQPVQWEVQDVEQPRACDLWHEGTVWLQSRKVPTSYRIQYADLAATDGAPLGETPLAIGGRIMLDDREIGITSEQRIVALQRNLLAPGDVDLTLGSQDTTLAEYLANTMGENVSQVALDLSTGLVGEAARIRVQGIRIATTAGNTTVDAVAPASVGRALKDAFKNNVL
jgi:hypothetical protein